MGSKFSMWLVRIRLTFLTTATRIGRKLPVHSLSRRMTQNHVTIVDIRPWRWSLERRRTSGFTMAIVCLGWRTPNSPIKGPDLSIFLPGTAISRTDWRSRNFGGYIRYSQSLCLNQRRRVKIRIKRLHVALQPMTDRLREAHKLLRIYNNARKGETDGRSQRKLELLHGFCAESPETMRAILDAPNTVQGVMAREFSGTAARIFISFMGRTGNLFRT